MDGFMHRDPMVWMAQEFEIRTRKLLEDDMRFRDLKYLRFRWNRYFPWFFMADILILVALAVAIRACIIYWTLR